MEKMPNFEGREREIDQMIERLAEMQEMTSDEIMSDLATYAPYEGNEDPNQEYLNEVAEMMGISVEELTAYAIKKAQEFLEE